MAQANTAFGAALRDERERIGVSLATLCAETKLNARHLEALENGDFRALPGGVFRRGIVRAYLHAVGLDEADWMPRFQASYDASVPADSTNPKADDEAWRTFALNVKKSRGRGRDGTRLRWIGVGLLFLLLVAAAWAVYHFLLLRK